MKKEGFTLVELILTLTLLVVIMTLAVPNIVRMVANNRERQLERAHNVVCEAAKVYAFRRDSCKSVASAMNININFNVHRDDMSIMQCLRTTGFPNEMRVQVNHLVENQLLDGNLTNPVEGGRYNYNEYIVFSRTNTLPFELVVRIGANVNGSYSCE